MGVLHAQTEGEVLACQLVSPLLFPVRLEVVATTARRTWTRESIITALRDTAEHGGHPPRKLDWHYKAAWGEPRRPCTPTVLRHFGSWNAALETAGLRPRLRSHWSRTQIIDAIRAWVDRTGTLPTHSAWQRRPSAEEPDRPTAHTVIERFGSWEAALRATGLEPPKLRRLWSAAEIVEAIRAFAAREGRAPTGRDWNSPPEPDHLRPMTHEVVDCFGSWNKGLAAAGFAPHRRDWSREEIVAALQEFAQRHGKTPRPGDWTRMSSPGEPAHPSRQTVVNQFGDWNAALEAAGLEPLPMGRRGVRREAAWTAAEIIEEIRAFAEREGEPPKSSDWRLLPRSGPPRPTAWVVEQCFGTWNKGIEAAGFTPRRRGWGRDLEVRRERTWSAAEIVEAIRAFAAREGEPPTSTAWRHLPVSEPPRPTARAVAQCFGNWSKGIEAAGFTPRHRHWNRDEIVAALRDFARRHGESPRSSDWKRVSSPGEPPHPNREIVRERFGGWRAALQAAGLEPPKSRNSWSAVEIIDAIRVFAEQEGRAPTGRDWSSLPESDHLRPTTTAVVKCFGSWNDGLAAAGFAPHRRDWSREEIVAALRESAQRHGKLPRASDWTRTSLPGELAHPSWATVVDHFGGWDEALRAAGFEPPPRSPRSWSAAEIIASIKAFAEREGEPPKKTDWKHLPASGPPRPNAWAVEQCFGSWSKGIEAAGFAPRQRHWDRDEIVAALREFAQRHGEPPKSSDWKRVSSPSEPPHPNQEIVRVRFGGWGAALEAAGLRPSRA